MTRYRPDIDGLRAVSVLAVVGYHVGLPWFSGGYVGVDVFFVISGYLITKLLSEELEKTGSISFLAFYARRARRLLPALLLVIATTAVVAGYLFNAASSRSVLTHSVAAALAMVPNIYFLRHTGGYFDASPETVPLLHLWSLGVEEQFYLLWPLLLLGTAKSRALTASAVGLVVLSSLLLAEVFIRQERPELAFFLMPLRAWELGMGALLALAPAGPLPGRMKCRLAGPVSLLGLVAIVLPVILYTTGTPFPGANAIAPVVGAAAIIWAGAYRGRITGLLSHPALVWLGLLSYGWYLWHWPLLAIARTAWPAEGSLPRDVLIALFALALAWLTFILVERPLRRGRLGSTRHNRIALGVAGAGCLTVALGSAAVLQTRHQGITFEGQRNTYRDDCHMTSRWDGKLALAECRVPASTDGDGYSLVVWGDSIADAWFPMAKDAAQRKHGNALQLSMSACAPLIGLTPLTIREQRNALVQTGRPRKETLCPMFNDAVWTYLSSLPVEERNKTSVLLAARWAGRLGERYPLHNSGTLAYFDIGDTSKTASLESLRKGLTRTLDTLDTIGIRRIGIMLPGPEFRYDLENCLTGQTRAEDCDTDKRVMDDYAGEASDLIRSIAEAHPEVRVFDPMAFFCKNGKCPAVFQGVPTVYDSFHPSKSAAILFGRSIDADISWLLGKTVDSNP